MVAHHSRTVRLDIEHHHCSEFLDQIIASDTCEPISAKNVCIVVAHPDDEAVGAGGQLARLKGVTVVHVTDGSPEDLSFARNRGFETREAYRTVREWELSEALALCRIPRSNQVRLGIRDQEASLRLIELTYRMASLFRAREISIVLTHPYEGGHPDHDATAFAVHAACRLLAENGEKAVAIIEMASYYAGPTGSVHQRFAPHPAGPGMGSILSPSQRLLKQEVLAAHISQAENLSVFSCETERFRSAPRYDFEELPNNGVLRYESFQSGMTGERWLALSLAALHQLRQVQLPWTFARDADPGQAHIRERLVHRS
ncbi:MAG: PIG-L family deacetylase [Proteobacteria bacterium]|nr:PIG-L family deacetylase [Pseudomonadota bacterium]